MPWRRTKSTPLSRTRRSPPPWSSPRGSVRRPARHALANPSSPLTAHTRRDLHRRPVGRAGHPGRRRRAEHRACWRSRWSWNRCPRPRAAGGADLDASARVPGADRHGSAGRRPRRDRGSANGGDSAPSSAPAASSSRRPGRSSSGCSSAFSPWPPGWPGSGAGACCARLAATGVSGRTIIEGKMMGMVIITFLQQVMLVLLGAAGVRGGLLQQPGGPAHDHGLALGARGLRRPAHLRGLPLRAPCDRHHRHHRPIAGRARGAPGSRWRSPALVLPGGALLPQRLDHGFPPRHHPQRLGSA